MNTLKFQCRILLREKFLLTFLFLRYKDDMPQK